MSKLNHHDRVQLEIALAKLLGHDSSSIDADSFSAIFNYILSFDKEQDLIEHIVLLIGCSDTDDKLLNFVENVARFQSGQSPLNLLDSLRDDDLSTLGNEIENSMMISSLHSTTKQEDTDRQSHDKKIESSSFVPTNKKDNNMSKTNIKNKKNKAKGNNNKRNIVESSSQSSVSGTNYESIKTSSPSTQQQPSSKPKRGTPKRTCGCFGTKHKPLTNCLHCGRISCEKEGYNFCPFCNYLVEEFKQDSITNTSSSNNNINSEEDIDAMQKALKHKERLIQFDRENASRTVVYDAEGDYYRSDYYTDVWLTEEEMIRAEKREEERRNQLQHGGNKQILNIQF